MERKFNIVACRSCKSKTCSRYLFHGSRSPYLVPSKDLGKPDCLFVKKISNSPQFQTLRLSPLELRMALRGFSSHGEWNPSHLSSLRRQKELCFKLIQQGKLKVLSPPYNGNELIAFKKWTEEEPHRGLFFRGGIPIAKKKEEPEKVFEEAVPVQEKHWIEFQFIYADKYQSPVSKERYILIYPDGSKIGGILGEDGKIRKDDIPEGTYTVKLKDIEKIVWGGKRIKCDEELKLFTRTSGYPDGTKGKFNIYREFKEAEEDIVDTIEAEIKESQIEISWKYDYIKDEKRRAETGISRFIAELVIDEDKRWAKTQKPLEIELKKITSAKWSKGNAKKGEEVEMMVQTLGFSDGTEGILEVWKGSLFGEDKRIKLLPPVKISGGELKTSWICEDFQSENQLQLGDAPIPPTSFECYFIVCIEDQVKRTAISNMLFCTGDDTNQRHL